MVDESYIISSSKVIKTKTRFSGVRRKTNVMSFYSENKGYMTEDEWI